MHRSVWTFCKLDITSASNRRKSLARLPLPVSPAVAFLSHCQRRIRHTTGFADAPVFGTNRTSSTKPFCYALHTMAQCRPRHRSALLFVPGMRLEYRL
jgi:hypothetical protein